MKKNLLSQKMNNDVAEEIINDPLKAVIIRHITSFLENDLEKLMEDYSDESVLITVDKTLKGIDQIRTFFIGLMKYFPKEKSYFKLNKLEVCDGIGFIIWQGKGQGVDVTFGTDTFIVVNNKIELQTFAGELIYTN